MTNQKQQDVASKKSDRMYVLLIVALAISFIAMDFLSLVQVNTLGDFYLNLSNTYMALLMVFSMAIIMIAVMWRMFKNKKLSVALLVIFALLFGGSFYLARTETLVGNEAFLKSMIPHHSRAILVCQESNITDPEIVSLCQEIVKSQQREINQMKDILKRY
ncbi:DUF305 domain-containing protein [Cryobacterium tepidiphilum]|nr:DUF305 domain-containing protein [Cryobacterium tepidiphilum]